MPNSHLSAGTPLGALGAVCFQTKSFRVAQTKPCFLLKATPISGAKRNVPCGTFRFAVRHLARTMVFDSSNSASCRTVPHGTFGFTERRLAVRPPFFSGHLQDRAFALFHMEQPHKALPAQKASAGAARCAVSRKGALNKKISIKRKRKKPFCIDNPYGLCYNVNVQKRSHPFWAVSFLTQFRPLAGSGQKSGFLAGDRRT